MYGNAVLMGQTLAQNSLGVENNPSKLRLLASKQFARLRLWAVWGRIWARLIGQNTHLRHLDHATEPQDGHYLGLQTVSIHLIVGSEGRSRDFDNQFRPLSLHNRERWIGIAVLRMMGANLPPVCLLQAGNEYFVRDGNHRISVARHLGQQDIEAEIVKIR